MNREILNPPAVVKQVDARAELIQRGKVLNAGITGRDRMNLEDALALGAILVKLKETSKHGEWESLLKEMRVPSQRASECMRLSKSPAPGISNCGSIAEARRLVAAHENQRDREPGEEGDEDPDVYYRANGATPAPSPTVFKPAPLPTVLKPGWVYFVNGSHREHGVGMIEAAERPGHPGYWVWALFYDNYEWSHYMGRGLRVDHFSLERICKSYDFAPGPVDVGWDWDAVPVEPGEVPLAVQWDRQDWKECKGRWAWRHPDYVSPKPEEQPT